MPSFMVLSRSLWHRLLERFLVERRYREMDAVCDDGVCDYNAEGDPQEIPLDGKGDPQQTVPDWRGLHIHAFHDMIVFLRYHTVAESLEIV
jgi:hypothetical protein